jgi:hypothetical protein
MREENRSRMLHQEVNERVRPVRLSLVERLRHMTFAPLWLPEPWCRPLMGYLLAGIVQAVAVSVVALLIHLLPAFAFAGLLAS